MPNAGCRFTRPACKARSRQRTNWKPSATIPAHNPAEIPSMAKRYKLLDQAEDLEKEASYINAPDEVVLATDYDISQRSLKEAWDNEKRLAAKLADAEKALWRIRTEIGEAHGRP